MLKSSTYKKSNFVQRNHDGLNHVFKIIELKNKK